MIEFLRLLRVRWTWLVASVLLGVGVAAGVTYFMTPSYRASSQLFVAIGNSQNNSSRTTALTIYLNSRIKSYPGLISSPLVLEPVIKKLGLQTTPEALADKISASVGDGTYLMDVTVDDDSPTLAAEIANEASKQLITVIENLDASGSSSDAPVKLSIVKPAATPTSPRTPEPFLNIALGLVGGLGLGIAAAGLRDVLDTSLKSEAEVEQSTGLPTIGVVPVSNDVSASMIGQGQRSKSFGWGEAYRKLRTNISYLDPDNPPRALLVTSSQPKEGKTTTAANLAATLAQSGRRVILLDADLRRPSIAKQLGLVPDVGLTNVIAGRATISEVVQQVDSFDVVTSGPIPPNPSELLGSNAFARLVETLKVSYDAIVIDSPPVLAVTDAAVMSTCADTVLLVCKANSTRRQELIRALDGLAAVDARVAGVVLNQMPVNSAVYYSYEYRPARQED
ncbi:polysaccharide biosynthesis tyrosine autokinase [Nocardioides sp. TRM66260-LWL]|uniref:polysaccharide biosynthesis tyrosine autokinase n=1 Tax=Nocardioides sp. TRM66260-LWL TaxID=2874478 RepID=UPI001CC5985C|nr:polysaccharide biosynthesis tyrosine autokinase [Nocardioides sp. TRM66260-LWL]MBZ5733285.1 polysaccharide biosynthesis tyrosine autokinase [Nocardioides sp. TRM66260-LWL]